MKRFFLVIAALLSGVLLVPHADAGHAGPRHWAGNGERTIRLVDSLTGTWDGARDHAVTGWNASTAINLTITAGSTTQTARKRCKPALGGIRVCNYNYGPTGWAGLATVFFDGANHIVKAKARLNTKYVKTDFDRKGVACHEIGHTLGLGHRLQAEVTSCMTPVLNSNSNSPDAHDLLDVTLSHTHAGAKPENEEITTEQRGPYKVVRIKLLAPR